MNKIEPQETEESPGRIVRRTPSSKTEAVPEEPKSEYWTCADDVPGPVCWLRPPNPDGFQCLIIEIRPRGVLTGTDPALFVRWDTIHNWEHSTDRKTWSPCLKPVVLPQAKANEPKSKTFLSWPQVTSPWAPTQQLMMGVNNPDHVTWDELEPEEGWRLLDQSEINTERLPNPGIYAFLDNRQWSQDANYRGNRTCITYRTKLPFPIP